MKISTEIRSISAIVGEEKAVEYVAKAGFDAWDFSMNSMCGFNKTTKSFEKADHPLSGNDYLSFAGKLRKIGEDLGIVCNQSHAPAPTYNKEIRSYLKRAIECTAEAGGKICVIHPDNYSKKEVNAEMYHELLPFAKECNVKIATENMFNWDKEKDEAMSAACSHHDDFKAHIDIINDDYFVACLDVGHSALKGLDTSFDEMVKALGRKIEALHIHDNDKHYDLHQIPFSGNIDFDRVLKALKEINYQGYFTLEAYKYLKDHNKDNVFNGVCELAKAAKKLALKYEQI